MASFLQNSVIIQIFLKILRGCQLVYDNSGLKVCLDSIQRSVAHSKTSRVLRAYANKPPYFVHSLAYRLWYMVGRLFNTIADKLHAFFDFISAGSAVRRVIAPLFRHYEKLVYLVAAYVFIDYIMRTCMPSFAASLWDEMLFVFLIGVWAVKAIAYRDEPSVKIATLDLPIVTFIVAVTFILIIQSPDIRISIEGYRAVIQYILWYFIVLQMLRTTDGAKNVCKVLVWVAILIALHGIYQYAVGVEMPAGWVDRNEVGVRTRIFSIIGSPNILGGLMTLTLPICVSFFFVAKSTAKKIMYGGCALLIMAALVFSFSRGAWLGFVGAVLVYVCMKDKRLLIPAIVVGILAVALVPSIGNRITYMLSPEYIASSLRGGRLVRWMNGLQILQQDPLIGVGLGHFGGAVAMNNGITRLIGVDVYKTFYMDNYYLKTAVESGLIGLGAFVALMYQVFICSLRTINLTEDNDIKELEIGILAGLTGIILHNLVENVFEVPMMATYFWMLAAVMMHLWYIQYFKNGKRTLV